MKKVFLSAAAVAATFMAFAFTSVKKNNAIDNPTTNTMSAAPGKCDTRFQTQTEFTACDRTWTEGTIEKDVDQGLVLDKY